MFLRTPDIHSRRPQDILTSCVYIGFSLIGVNREPPGCAKQFHGDSASAARFAGWEFRVYVVLTQLKAHPSERGNRAAASLDFQRLTSVSSASCL
jgi:hypothetical protein